MRSCDCLVLADSHWVPCCFSGASSTTGRPSTTSQASDGAKVCVCVYLCGCHTLGGGVKCGVATYQAFMNTKVEDSSSSDGGGFPIAAVAGAVGGVLAVAALIIVIGARFPLSASVLNGRLVVV